MGGTEYEYDVHAVTGKVIKAQHETVKKPASSGTTTAPAAPVQTPSTSGGASYQDTDYGPGNDGVTDYNDTDYGPNNDGVTDYNSGNSGYDNGNSGYDGGNSGYSNSGYDDGNSGYDD